jgi:hypothetical protein
MIIYQLQCGDGHEFEGWFSDIKDYDSQKQKSILACPVCSSSEVGKVLSGVPTIKKVKAKPRRSSTPKAKNQAQQNINAADMVAVLKTVEHYVKKNFDNVGKNFYNEAVKMNSGETDKRGIYGEVTTQQRSNLDDKNIDYALLPKLGPEFEN